jgi:hypothetical protein
VFFPPWGEMYGRQASPPGQVAPCAQLIVESTTSGFPELWKKMPG